MSFTTTWENEVLNYLFGNVAITLPSSFFIGLHVGGTAPANNGTGIVEPTGGYQRVAVARNQTNFPVTSTGQIANGTKVNFPQATANWGTPTHWFIANVQRGGASEKVYLVGQLGTSKTVLKGDTPSFDANGLLVSLK